MQPINEGGQEVNASETRDFCVLCDDHNHNLGPYDACTCCDAKDWDEKDE